MKPVKSEARARRLLRSSALLTVGIVIITAGMTANAAGAPDLLDGKVAWRFIGPYIGGRVVAVAGVAGERKLFAGAVDGGVWESANYGVTWRNITDGRWPSASDSVGAIAVAPSDPKVLYVGTGEPDPRNDMVTGDGVFKSVDGGKTWKHAGLRDTRTISAIVVAPHDANTVYAASMGHVFKPDSDRGVFKSVDGGKTWLKVLFVDNRTGAIGLVMDPQDPRVLYTAMWQVQRTPWSLDDGGPGSGIYKSTDGGAHWSNITHHAGLPHGLLGRVGLSVSASNPDIVFAIIQARGGGIFRSRDGGLTWQHMNDNWSLRQRGFYFTSITVDPRDPDIVYVPNLDLWVSRNGGKSFSKLHAYGDNHTVWVDPVDPRTLLLGNDGGVSVSVDGGATWSAEDNQPTGQFYHVAVDHQFPFNVYGAQQDEGSFEGPSALPGGVIPNGAWHSVALGESTFIAPDQYDAAVTYGSDAYTIMQRYEWTTGARRDVSPYPIYLDGVSAAEMKYRFGWTHPIFFGPDDPHKLFLASQYVMTSSDGGRTWKTISPDLTRNDPATEQPSGGPIDLDQTGAEVFPNISALAVSTVDSRVIWAGSQDGLVHVTSDGGRHWQLVTPPQLAQWAEISSIEPSHVAAGTAYLTASRYMWDDYRPFLLQTTDFGRHWSTLTEGLPEDEPLFVVRQDPVVPSLLFVGTANGVYTSLNAGVHWQPLRANLPHAEVRDLAIDTREGELVAATHGRSFWILDDLAVLEQLSQRGLPAADSTVLYKPQRAWLTNAYGGESFHASFVGSNHAFGATVFFHLPVSYDGKLPASVEIRDDQDRRIRQFSLHLRSKLKRLPPTIRDNLLPSQAKRMADEEVTAVSPGLNRFQWNLRYPDATDVVGYEAPWGNDGQTANASGPLVNPGKYTLVLHYGRDIYRQTLEVSLDPRLGTTAAALKEHLALQLELYDTIDTLDRKINMAIVVRERLAAAVTAHTAHSSSVRAAISDLDGAIEAVVNRNVRSSLGDIMHEMRLRSFLAYLQSDVGLDYGPPNPAMLVAARKLENDARLGEARLQAATIRGRSLLPNDMNPRMDEPGF